MAHTGIRLDELSGSAATDRLHATIAEFNAITEQQARTMIRLTLAIVGLTLVLVIGLVIQIVALLTG